MGDNRNQRANSGVRSSGSVLVFAVVVLAILAMVSTAFLIVVRHAILAAKSSVNSTQPDTSAETGVIRANHALRTALLRNIIATQNGVVAFGQASNDAMVLNVPGDCMELLHPGDTLPSNFTVGDLTHSSSDYLSPLSFFEHDPSFETQHLIQYPSFAVLSSHFPHTLNNKVISTPYYTSSPLRINASVGTADWATPYYLRSNFTEFYNGDATNGANQKKYRQISGSIGTIRGRHFVWVRDLDACFYAIPAMWGLRSPANVSGTSYSAAEQQIALNILEYLRNTPGSEMTPNPYLGKNTWLAPNMATIAGLAPKNYAHIGDVALSLQSYPQLHISDQFTYEFWRADLENYFTTTLDATYNANGTTVNNSLGQPITAFKPAAAAMNINTVPEEVLQAMLSQIPCWDPVNKIEKTFATYVPAGVTPIPATAQQPCLAELVAKRIMAKRPFLSRMDFEDFAASLLPYDTTVPNVTTPLTNNLNTELGLLIFAMNKRVDGEITLGQFMDMPGLPNSNYANGDINPYVGANTRQGMLNRFAYFLADDANRAYYNRKDCELSVKAFNNLLNSVSSSPGINIYDYQQLIAPGTGSSTSPNALEITAAAGATTTPIFDTIQLGGDDQFTRDANGKIIGINTGKNGIAETQISGFSYYSHDFGGRFSDYEYKPYRLKDDPTYANADFTSPRDCGKFVYGDPAQQYVPLSMQNAQSAPPGTNPGYKNYFISDLQKWSCVGDGKLSGYYDMFFNPADGMKHEFGEAVVIVPPAVPTQADYIAVESATGTALKTGQHTDDIQEVDFGDPTDDVDFVVVLPGPNGRIETEINKNNSVLTPGGAQQAPTGNDKVVRAIRYAPPMSDPVTTDGIHLPNGDILYASFGDRYLYIVPAFGSSDLKSQTRPLDPGLDPVANKDDADAYVEVIVDFGPSTSGKSDTQIHDDDVLVPDTTNPALATITVGPNKIQETTVWGPIRASQRPQDTPRPPTPPAPQPLNINLNADQTATAQFSSNSSGDVAWSPPICFRSRYYATYVLAEGMLTQATVGTVGPVLLTAGTQVNQVTFKPLDTTKTVNIVPGSFFAVNSAPINNLGVPIAGAPLVQHVYMVESYVGTTLTLSSPLVATINTGDFGAVYSSKKIGERRVESIYDAFTDTTLWTRSPLTDKRTLGDQ